MGLVDQLAEEQIQAAMERGEFDDLPGKGKPLELDDDSMVPEHLRTGYRLLKNAGFIPPELEQRKEALKLADLVATLGHKDPAAKKALADLYKLELRMRISGVDTTFIHHYLNSHPAD